LYFICSLILVPEDNRHLVDTSSSIITLPGGGISFFLMERFTGTKEETPLPNAMLLDYIPESPVPDAAFTPIPAPGLLPALSGAKKTKAY
jgi:hypothetical protein